LRVRLRQVSQFRGIRRRGTQLQYFAPSTVEEAVEMLASGPELRVFAGATDVVPQTRSGRPVPVGLVDLKKIDRLMSVEQQDTQWVVGAATPTSRLTSNAAFVADLPGVAEAAGLIGSDQVQNRSSLGGNLCNASPAADSVPAMVAAAGRAVIASGAGTRTVAIADVPTGPGSTSLAPGEFIVEFEFDRPAAGQSDAYLRMIPRTEMDIAVVGAGVNLTMDGSGTCTAASVILGAVAPTIVRVPDAEAALVGSSLDDDALAAAAAAASAACNPIDDKRGTIKYRKHVAGVLTKRAAKIAAERAAGGAQ
jgi:CO/xanthine dehydrogenase FAD-binding subunit